MGSGLNLNLWQCTSSATVVPYTLSNFFVSMDTHLEVVTKLIQRRTPGLQRRMKVGHPFTGQLLALLTLVPKQNRHFPPLKPNP